MTAATLYAHYDDSAPQFTSTSASAGDLYYILKGVLIDGYGSKSPVGGWTIAYDDEPNKTLVLKQAGEDRYIRIDDGQNYQWATMLYYDSMTDVDTGTGQLPPSGDLGSYKYFISKRTNSSYNAWHMVVANDGSFVYFFTKEPSYSCGFFFGLLNNEEESQRRFAISGYLGSSWSASLFPQSLYTSTFVYVDRDRYDTGYPEKSKLYYDGADFIQPNPVDGKLILQNVTIVSNSSPLALFGLMPNMKTSLGSTSGFFIEGVPLNIDGTDYVFIDYADGFFFSLS